MTSYQTAKFTLLGLIRALAAAAKFGKKNIKVNAVAPSMIDTQFLIRCRIWSRNLHAKRADRANF